MLSPKQKLFCEEYIANGMNASQAYAKIYKKSPESSYSSRLMNNPEVKEYLEKRRQEIYDAYNIDAMRVMEEIAHIAFGEVDENDTINYSLKLKALELLSKNLNLQTVKTENKDVIEVQLVEDVDE